MTFKIGDRVKLTTDLNILGCRPGVGMTGRIVSKSYAFDWRVLFDNVTEEMSVLENEVELVDPEEVPTSGASIPVYVLGKKDPAYYVEGDRPKIVADGGPQEYYDLPSNWNTFNDFIEYKSLHQWKEHSFHLGNIGKAICRWGDKDGATKEYDAKKIIYSACRVLKNIIGVENLRHYLQKLLDDPQFQSKE